MWFSWIRYYWKFFENSSIRVTTVRSWFNRITTLKKITKEFLDFVFIKKYTIMEVFLEIPGVFRAVFKTLLNGYFFCRDFIFFLKQTQLKSSSTMVSVFSWGTHLYMSLLPSVRRAPYLRNHTLSDHSFWYTCVKWWYLQVFLFLFFCFDFSGC